MHNNTIYSEECLCSLIDETLEFVSDRSNENRIVFESLASLKERLTRQADYLALTNVENWRWNTRLNMDETFRKFSREFEEKFDSAVEATERALSEALKWREKNEDSIDRQAGEIEVKIDALKSIIDRLKGKTE